LKTFINILHDLAFAAMGRLTTKVSLTPCSSFETIYVQGTACFVVGREVTLTLDHLTSSILFVHVDQVRITLRISAVNAFQKQIIL
jgi:hypothetical protein